MTHPIVDLQGALVLALRADAQMTALVGADGVFDAPPPLRSPPYVTIARHDLLARDGDTTPGHEHRVLFHVWADDASRKAALAIVERIVAVSLATDLESAALKVTLRRHERTDTAIDAQSGKARAAVAMSFFSEPNA
ncbi:MAG: DUF3168 domain-containing protein [Devosia sp.]